MKKKVTFSLLGNISSRKGNSSISSGDLAEAKGHFEEAVKHFNEAKENGEKPNITDFRNAYINLATTLVKQNEFEKARTCVEKAKADLDWEEGSTQLEKLKEIMFMSYFNEGALCMKSDSPNYDKAIKLFEKAKELKPTDENVIYNLTCTQVRGSAVDPVNALATLKGLRGEKAEEAKKQIVVLYNKIGIKYLSIGEYKEFETFTADIDLSIVTHEDYCQKLLGHARHLYHLKKGDSRKEAASIFNGLSKYSSDATQDLYTVLCEVNRSEIDVSTNDYVELSGVDFSYPE